MHGSLIGKWRKKTTKEKFNSQQMLAKVEWTDK